MSFIQKFAERVDTAAISATSIPQITQEQDFGVDEAYAIQAASIDRRVQRGDPIVGIKMGFTSRAKMVQMGVSDLIWGRLTRSMIVEDGGFTEMSRYIHPRAEPEIAFLLRKPLSGVVTPLQALDAVGGVACAIELIDSRYENFKFSLADVVADNASSSGFVVGTWREPGTDLSNIGMVMNVDGRPVGYGSSAAILGDPVRALVSAARVAGEAGLSLEPGMVVMAGAATAAIALEAGQHVRLEASGLGFCEFRIR
ncbi:2-keto-4-pentenoate hydratase [Acetobacter sp. DsW_063]|uniref:2-keto-4-pentenoate hydratase n=1 Tax=Acetobacter sp. DsW_063 TaxID=1514894 RepID=UPI000A3C0142|nr:fumarylacetoacetate hydrolase family protein [Acetobacter sp. DsW_063]OUJ11069.1 4-oxalocrotonate decarboxylase [Acetobacter sp. DsW_063]